MFEENYEIEESTSSIFHNPSNDGRVKNAVKIGDVEMYRNSSTAFREEKEDPRCMFESTQCEDKLNPYICNFHASTIFHLLYKRVNYTDGNNESSSLIVTYFCSPSAFQLPLLMQSGGIYMENVESYASSIVARCPNMDLDEVINILFRHLDANAYHKTGGWFENEDSRVVMYNTSNNMLYSLPELPLLHRKLLCYCVPSLTINRVNNYQTYYVSNMQLVSDPATNKWSFVMMCKENVLKYTDHPDCVATPIVLLGQHILTAPNEALRIAPIENVNLGLRV